MKMLKILFILLVLCFSPYGFAKISSYQGLLSKLYIPKGFQVTVFEDNLPAARSLALGGNGIVYIGTGEGSVYAVEDTNHDGIADNRYTIAKGLYMPNGVAYKDGALYVAEINRIIRFDGITQKLDKSPKSVVVYDKFPSDKHHGWKYLRFGPDGKLYTAIGAPCNICKPDKPYGSMVRLNPDGSQFEIIAQGIRNTVGFDWQPETNVLFFNEHGRDYLGDDMPPEELNQWSKLGDHFGYPYCHGGKFPDPELGKEKSCREFIPPVWTYNAHNAPLGLLFYRGKQFPVAYQKQLFVALHGSWNRTQPDGYKVLLVKFKDGKPVSDEVFISGWLTETNQVLGRPVDILELPDGSLLISDDHAGLIYRIVYTGK